MTRNKGFLSIGLLIGAVLAGSAGAGMAEDSNRPEAPARLALRARAGAHRVERTKASLSQIRRIAAPHKGQPAAAGPQCSERAARRGPRYLAAESASLSLLDFGSSASLVHPAGVVPLGASETFISQKMSLLPPRDRNGAALGLPDGRLVVVGLEEYRLFSARSTDAGATFSGTETTIAGGTGQKPVFNFSAANSASGRVFVAMEVADPKGDQGLQFVRSDDMGLTWGQPIDLVTYGYRAHGIVDPKIVAGPNNLVAIAFKGEEESYPYVLVSADAGQTWNGPTRLGPSVGGAPLGYDLVFRSDGVLFVAFTQTRHTGEDIKEVVVAKSTNNGSTFTEVGLNQFIANEKTSYAPVLALTEKKVGSQTIADGTVLVAFYSKTEDTSDTGLVTNLHLFVLRSENDAASFSTALDSYRLFDATAPVFTPKLYANSAASTILLLTKWADFPQASYAYLDAYASSDKGVSFGAAEPITDYLSSSTYSDYFAALFPGSTPETKTWCLFWTDGQTEPTFGILTDVIVQDYDLGGQLHYLNRSDSGTPTLAYWTSGLVSVTPAGSGAQASVFALWADNRDDAGTNAVPGFNLWGNRFLGETHSPAVGTAARVDKAEGTNVAPANSSAPYITTNSDGTRVFVAMNGYARKAFHDIQVAASADSGKTFGAPVLVQDLPATSLDRFDPRLAYGSNGVLYTVYQSHNVNNSAVREIRFNYSSDNGATWASPATALASMTVLSGLDRSPDTPDPQLVIGTGTVGWVGWTEYNSTVHRVMSRRFQNSGAVLDTPVVVDQIDYAQGLRICRLSGATPNTKLLAVYLGMNSALVPNLSIFAKTSTDDGTSWSARAELPASAQVETIYTPLSLTCDSNGKAVVHWAEFRSSDGYIRVRSALYNGTAWEAEKLLPQPSSMDVYNPVSAITSVEHLLVAFETSYGDIYTTASANDGATYSAAVRRDPATPDFYSSSPRLASDRNGKVWLSWLDFTDGVNGSIYSKYSSDGGQNFGAIYRIDASSPAGSYPESFADTPLAATAGGKAFFAWNGWRSGAAYETVYQLFDPNDMDQDGVGASDNCPNISNPNQADADGDTVGDLCDNCRSASNTDQLDFDKDGIGNVCETGAVLADIDNSGRVDGFDLAALGRAFGKNTGEIGYDARADLNRDGHVDGNDLALFAPQFGKTIAP